MWHFAEANGLGGCRRHRRLAPIPPGGGAREFQLLKPGSADRGERHLAGFAADCGPARAPGEPCARRGHRFWSQVSLCALAHLVVRQAR